MGITFGDLGSSLLRMASVVVADLPADPLDRRDPAFIREQRDFLGALCQAWYAPDVLGLDHLPEGRALVVGTHNGGYMAPDMFSLMVASWHAFDPAERPAYGLAHDVVFQLPWAGRWIAKLGGVPASPVNAERLLRRDVTVLVYPGGDRDAFKPFRARHTVDFAGRKGFIRLALRTGAPIVPVVSVGAHEVFRVLTDGAKLAQWLGLKKHLRVDVLPIALGLPTGLVVGAAAPYLPMPTKIRLRVLPPIALDHPPEAAADAAIVDALYARIIDTMQRGVDALVLEGGFGVKARFRS
jgi:1-acyl-sn-glycerol-3-phosphate acyltransferase